MVIFNCANLTSQVQDAKRLTLEDRPPNPWVHFSSLRSLLEWKANEYPGSKIDRPGLVEPLFISF